MIAYLQGKFISKTPSNAIIDIGGIAYDVNISLNTYSAIQNMDSGLLHTHLLIREDAHQLFGFYDVKEKELFALLISVSGIGAGSARLMLSYMKPDEIITAIAMGDSKTLEKIKGIGKKTAERAILELRDKIGKQSIATMPSFEKGSNIKQEALEALTALGINKTQAENTVYKILQTEPMLSLEELIKKALKGI